MPKTKTLEITVPMAIDVDGAPNAYARNNAEALDLELNAHVGGRPDGKIVGYRRMMTALLRSYRKQAIRSLGFLFPQLLTWTKTILAAKILAVM
jgi:hypothetical protein